MFGGKLNKLNKAPLISRRSGVTNIVFINLYSERDFLFSTVWIVCFIELIAR